MHRDQAHSSRVKETSTRLEETREKDMDYSQSFQENGAWNPKLEERRRLTAARAKGRGSARFLLACPQERARSVRVSL